MFGIVNTRSSCNLMTFGTYEELGLKGMNLVKSMMILVGGFRSRPMGIVEDAAMNQDAVKVVTDFVVVHQFNSHGDQPPLPYLHI